MLIHDYRGYLWNNTTITADEYAEILQMLRNPPIAPDGYKYRLRSDLTWELVEAEQEESNTDISAEEALQIIVGGNANDQN